MGNEKEPCCGNCRFYRWFYADREVGSCLRHAPTINTLTVTTDRDEEVTIDGAWPMVAAFQWCGDWEEE